VLRSSEIPALEKASQEVKAMVESRGVEII
jgi:hypothetical protein